MTRKQHIAKAENIIHAALHQIEQAAESAAYMSGHAIRFASCYTMQELDAMQKKCNAEQIKSDTLSAIYHDMRNNCESVKVLDFAALWLWYPRIRPQLSDTQQRTQSGPEKRLTSSPCMIGFMTAFRLNFGRMPQKYETLINPHSSR